jgi:hypothetical protein
LPRQGTAKRQTDLLRRRPSARPDALGLSDAGQLSPLILVECMAFGAGSAPARRVERGCVHTYLLANQIELISMTMAARVMA